MDSGLRCRARVRGRNSRQGAEVCRARSLATGAEGAGAEWCVCRGVGAVAWTRLFPPGFGVPGGALRRGGWQHGSGAMVPGCPTRVRQRVLVGAGAKRGVLGCLAMAA